KATLDLPIQLVDGYKGTAEIRLAADAGALPGSCWGWGAMKENWARAFQFRDCNVVLQVTAKKIPDLPNVPLALDLAKSEEARQLLKAGAINPAAIAPGYAPTPPPPEKSAPNSSQRVYGHSHRPEIPGGAQKTNLDVNPLTGEEVKKIV